MYWDAHMTCPSGLIHMVELNCKGWMLRRSGACEVTLERLSTVVLGTFVDLLKLSSDSILQSVYGYSEDRYIKLRAN